jgi:hypothetical protein
MRCGESIADGPQVEGVFDALIEAIVKGTTDVR